MENTNKNNQFIFALLFVVIMSLIACSSHSKIKDPKPIPDKSLSNALMVVAVKDEKFQGYSQNIGQQVGMQYGAFGVIIGAILDGTAKLSDKNKKLLYYDTLGWLVTVDYKGKLAMALEQELSTIDWIEIKRTDTDWNIRESWLKRRMDLLDMDSAILVKANSELPKNYRCLNLNAKISIYQRESSIKKKYETQSKHATCQEPGLSSDVYLAKWAKDNGTLIKSEMEKSISEFAFKIKFDLSKRKTEMLQNKYFEN